MVMYSTGEPPKPGVYACRVPMDLGAVGGYAEDKFLLWHSGRWSYLRSAENYRGKVIGWIGPLDRKNE